MGGRCIVYCASTGGWVFKKIASIGGPLEIMAPSGGLGDFFYWKSPYVQANPRQRKDIRSVW